MKMIKNGENNFTLVDNHTGARFTGTLLEICAKAWQLGIDQLEMQEALKTLKTKDHKVAHFGVTAGIFMYTLEA